MQFLVPPLLSAPLVTGHPQGLPGDQPDPMEQTRVQPVSDARDPEARMKEGQSPTQFWAAVNGKPDPDNHTAPPSIMQITISRMLDEQNPARKREVEAPPVEEPEPRFETRAATEPRETRQAESGPDQPVAVATDSPDQPSETKEARSSVFSTLP